MMIATSVILILIFTMIFVTTTISVKAQPFVIPPNVMKSLNQNAKQAIQKCTPYMVHQGENFTKSETCYNALASIGLGCLEGGAFRGYKDETGYTICNDGGIRMFMNLNYKGGEGMK